MVVFDVPGAARGGAPDECAPRDSASAPPRGRPPGAPQGRGQAPRPRRDLPRPALFGLALRPKLPTTPPQPYPSAKKFKEKRE